MQVESLDIKLQQWCSRITTQFPFSLIPFQQVQFDFRKIASEIYVVQITKPEKGTGQHLHTAQKMVGHLKWYKYFLTQLTFASDWSHIEMHYTCQRKFLNTMCSATPRNVDAC